MPQQKDSKYLRFSDLKAQYSLTRSTVYDFISQQGFPKQIHLGNKTVVFNRDAVDAWFAEREAMSAR